MSSQDPFAATIGPELFFGLVSPIGADLELVCDELDHQLSRMGYQTYTIKLSDQIRKTEKYKNLPMMPEDIRIAKHMAAGTDIRETSERGDALALMSVARVRNFREENGEGSQIPLTSQAYLFRSLKHPEEVKVLRAIYGNMFFVISVYSPRDKRVNRLAKAISDSRGHDDSTKFLSAAEKLVQIDEEEEGRDLGQDVSDAFPLADFFVNSKSHKHVRNEIHRFIDIVFNHPFHTPTRDEMGMYFAHSAALRSADLSRQVGAVIVNSSTDILSAGCNDVPAPLGGQYWPDDDTDMRDFQLGYDSTMHFRNKIVKQVIDKFRTLKYFNKELNKKSTDEITSWILSEEGKKVFRGADIFNLLEFGRPIHAEMAAITSAARLGAKLHGAILFSTTFPCHMCARHIISSGIKKVIYIDPYPKSKVKELYEDSICIDEDEENSKKVNFVSFEGIAPNRFRELFSMPKRKDDSGIAVKWREAEANPKVRSVIIGGLLMEQRAVDFVFDLFKDKGIELAK